MDAERTHDLNDAMAEGYTTYGMQTFDQSLMSLLRANLITYEEALRQCTNPDDFALRVQGVSSTSDSTWDSFESTGQSAPAQGTPAPASPSGGSDDFEIERF